MGTETSTKETNPKDAVGTGKAPLSTISGQVLAEIAALRPGVILPWRVLFEVGIAMLEGALKYGRHNYRTAGVRASVYYDAVMRHRAARECGQPIDDESGMPHIVKEIAGLIVLRDSMLQGNWVDDRPPKAKAQHGALGLPLWWEGLDADADGVSLVVGEINALITERSREHARHAELVGVWLSALNARAKALVEKYPNPPAAHIELKVAPSAKPIDRLSELEAPCVRCGTVYYWLPGVPLDVALRVCTQCSEPSSSPIASRSAFCEIEQPAGWRCKRPKHSRSEPCAPVAFLLCARCSEPSPDTLWCVKCTAEFRHG